MLQQPLLIADNSLHLPGNQYHSPSTGFDDGHGDVGLRKQELTSFKLACQASGHILMTTSLLANSSALSFLMPRALQVERLQNLALHSKLVEIFDATGKRQDTQQRPAFRFS